MKPPSLGPASKSSRGKLMVAEAQKQKDGSAMKGGAKRATESKTPRPPPDAKRAKAEPRSPLDATPRPDNPNSKKWLDQSLKTLGVDTTPPARTPGATQPRAVPPDGGFTFSRPLDPPPPPRAPPQLPLVAPLSAAAGTAQQQQQRQPTYTALMKGRPAPHQRLGGLSLMPVLQPGDLVYHRCPADGGQQQQQALDFCRGYGRGGYGSGGSSSGGGRRPVGLFNLGNTCYLNAVLQVLLGLPGFVGDLRLATKALGPELPKGGVVEALLECASATSSGAAFAVRPTGLKKAMGARMAAFEGTFQQDAHEFFCGLLDVLQGEVLAAEAGRQGRPLIRVSETLDPAARSFSFAVEHELTCTLCRHQSRVTEEYMHLSLELPPQQAQHGQQAQQGAGALPDVPSLLQSYFQDETVEKRCEGCSAAEAAHSVRHSIRRLPRVLALHMKRFQITLSADGVPSCQKLHTPVEISQRASLAKQVSKHTLPPLPARHGTSGKENWGDAANQPASQETPPAGGAAAAAAAAALVAGASLEEVERALPNRTAALGHGLPVQRGSFYGGGGGGGQLGLGSAFSVSPLAQSAAQGLTAMGSGGGYDEEAELQRALELSMQDQQAQQRQHPASLSLSPELGGAAAPAASASGAAAAAAGPGPVAAAAARRVSFAGEGPTSCSQEDRDLQRAMEASLIEAGGKQQQAQQQQQQQQAQQGTAPSPSVADLLGEAGEGWEGLCGQASVAAAAAARSDSEWAAGGVVLLADEDEGEEGRPAVLTLVDVEGAAAPSRPVARIVEDDALGSPAANGGDGGGGSAADAARQPSSKPPQALYRLQAVVNHAGTSALSGHFTADVLDTALGAWFRHDDSVTQRISAAQVAGRPSQRECYLLFYVHQD